MVINVIRKPFSNENEIEVWNSEEQKLLPLDLQLEELKFTNQQIDFLDTMFHKLVNLKQDK